MPSGNTNKNKYSGDRDKVLVYFPVGIMVDLRRIAKIEHRTLTGLIQECARGYIERFNEKNNTLLMEKFAHAIQPVPHATHKDDARGVDEV